MSGEDIEITPEEEQAWQELEQIITERQHTKDSK